MSSITLQYSSYNEPCRTYGLTCCEGARCAYTVHETGKLFVTGVFW